MIAFKIMAKTAVLIAARIVIKMTVEDLVNSAVAGAEDKGPCNREVGDRWAGA